MVGSLLELPRVATRQDDGSGRRAFGIGSVGSVKEDAFTGNTIEGGRPYPFTTVGTGVAEGPVIGDGKEDVGTVGTG